jgi:hypothetical protein
MHIDVAAKVVDLSAAVMAEGGILLVQGDTAQIDLGQISLGGPLRVGGKGPDSAKPRILGLQNADAGQMTFARVDMTRCSFYGAHGLGTIDIESTVTFPSKASWFGSRRFIADEYAWRSHASKLMRRGRVISDVHVGDTRPPPKKGESQKVLLPPLSAEQVAAIYRDLRRSLESKSDMPGAADFYYGEMEMRKWSRNRSWTERLLIWGYWVLSGYGLRPGRAFLAWVALVVVGACFLGRGGVDPASASALEVWIAAIRSTLPGVTTGEALTTYGRVIETCLRAGGAVIVALFVLSARTLIMRKPGE